MHWNYRLVNTPSENDGEDWFVLKEVYYNDDGTPMGYASACVGGDTLDEARHVFNKYIFEGVGKPALHEDDFKNASFKEGGGVMRWLFIWMNEDLNMAYEVYSCPTKLEAALRFKTDHPDAFAFAVIGGEDFGVEEFHA